MKQLHDNLETVEHRASRTEDYAVTRTLLAMAAMEEAEEATLEAIANRLAEAAAKTTKK